MSVSTSVHGDFSGRSGGLEGYIDLTIARVRDHDVELKSIAPRLAMLEGEPIRGDLSDVSHKRTGHGSGS